MIMEWTKVSNKLPRRDYEHSQFSDNVVLRVKGRELLGYFNYVEKTFFHTLDFTPTIQYLVYEDAEWIYDVNVDCVNGIPLDT